MISVKQAAELLNRFKEGETVATKDWDNKILPQTVKKILKKYDLKGTYNAKIPINQDMELADRFFEAGMELAEILGIHCTDTETVVKFSRKEIENALKQMPEEVVMGSGSDRITLAPRGVEDKKPPRFCTSLSIQIDENIYPALVSELVKYKGIDILQGPSIDTIFGMPVFSGTPFETAAGIREAQLRKEALARAGRPQMAQMGMSSSVTEYGFMCGYPMVDQPHDPLMGICLQPSELKTNYSSFHKVMTTAAFGGFMRSGCPSMIGGYSGPPEGAAVSNIASDIMQYVMFGSEVACSSLYDVRLNTACCRTGLWAMSVSIQATSRNTNMILDKIINQSAGPCTEDILYTNTAGLVATCVSGMELTTGPRSAGGAKKNYITPLEAYFCADAFKAAAKLDLSKALELVDYCLSKYEANVDNQPAGKNIYECYDVRSMTPSKEWTDIDDKVRNDLIKRGLDI